MNAKFLRVKTETKTKEFLCVFASLRLCVNEGILGVNFSASLHPCDFALNRRLDEKDQGDDCCWHKA